MSSKSGRVRAVILAAGHGTRLRPLTERIPKPLVEVAGHPLITYGLALLRRHGIEEVVVNAHHLRDLLMESLGDGSRYGVRIRYSVEPELLDTGGGIRQAVSLLDRPLDGPIVVLNSDVISEVPITDVVRFHRERDALVTMVLRDDPRKESYGVFGIDESGRIRRFLGQGDPAEGLAHYMFGSVQVLSPELNERMPPEGAFSTMHGIYPELFRAGEPFFGYLYAGRWLTVDTPGELETTARALRAEGLPEYMEPA